MSNLLVHELLLDPAVLRMALVLGVFVAAIIYDRLHLTTGSVLVPGYLGASILNPTMIFLTLLVALGVFWTVYKLIPRYWLMGRRQKLLAAISISAIFQFILLQATGLSGLYWVSMPLLLGVGYVIPGLLAHDIARHGLIKAIAITSGATLIVAIIVAALYAIFQIVGPESTLSAPPQLTFGIQWIGVALLASIIASAGLQNSFGLKAGGFVGSGYLCLILFSLPDVIYLITLSLATYWLVTRVLMKQNLILFGRRKFISIMLCGAILSWSVLLLAEHGTGYQGFRVAFMPMASIFLPGLFANDIERVGIARVAIGTVLVTALVLLVTFLAIEITGGQRTTYILPLVLLSGLLTSLIFVRLLPERLVNLMGRSSNI